MLTRNFTHGRGGRAGLGLAAVFVAGVWIGSVSSETDGTTLADRLIPTSVAFAAYQSGSGEDGDYRFFVHRRYCWVVKKSTNTARFFRLPETATDADQIEKSGAYQIDSEMYPAGQVDFQLSERNLANYLWITNRVTGRAHFVRAKRDGGFEESPILEAGL